MLINQSFYCFHHVSMCTNHGRHQCAAKKTTETGNASSGMLSVGGEEAAMMTGTLVTRQLELGQSVVLVGKF